MQLQLEVQRRLHEQLEVHQYKSYFIQVVLLMVKAEVVVVHPNAFVQIQRSLQMQIEEQGRQLKLMFEQQQKKQEGVLKTRESEVMPLDDHPFSIEDVEVSMVESYENVQFPSHTS